MSYHQTIGYHFFVSAGPTCSPLGRELARQAVPGARPPRASVQAPGTASSLLPQPQRVRDPRGGPVIRVGESFEETHIISIYFHISHIS